MTWFDVNLISLLFVEIWVKSVAILFGLCGIKTTEEYFWFPALSDAKILSPILTSEIAFNSPDF